MADEVEHWPIGRLLSTAARLFAHSWESLLQAHGLTHAGLVALHGLLEGPVSQRTLARACHVTDQTISRTVERLERDHFVTRTVDPADERRQLVQLTRGGRAVHELIVSTQQADALLATMVSDAESLRRQLIELVRALDRSQDQP